MFHSIKKTAIILVCGILFFCGCCNEVDQVADSVRKISECKFSGDFACYCARLGGELLTKLLRFPYMKKQILIVAKKNKKSGVKLNKVVLQRVSVDTRNAKARVRFYELFTKGKQKWKRFHSWEMEYIDGQWKAIAMN